MKRFLVFTLLFLSVFLLRSQDLEYVKSTMDKLCAEDMHGRGYISAGEKNAAYLIENEFKRFNMLPYSYVEGKVGTQAGKRIRNFIQEFTIKVNTFPTKVRLTVDGTDLQAGSDFVLKPSSGPIGDKELDLFYLTKKHIKDEKAYDAFSSEDYTAVCVVIDVKEFEKEKDNEYYEMVLQNDMRADALMLLVDGVVHWGVSQTFDQFPTYIVKKDKLPKKAAMIEVMHDTKYYYSYKTQNVIGKIEGKTYKDQYIIIGAHYDHLGMMGDVYFPGANDNASGTAMMLDLAKYYADVFNQPEYTMLFVGFGAEEAGLLGSKYFVENSPVPLEKVRMMINLDMMSSGEGGLMVVNTKKNNSDFNKIKQINTKKQYVEPLMSRGEAANSDHHYFHQAGVPALFFYLMGEEGKEYYYHNPKDVPSNVSMMGYNASFKLITEFIGKL
jgi:aminopeptidase YwaD